jgi:phosphopantothenate-cysteine ligase
MAEVRTTETPAESAAEALRRSDEEVDKFIADNHHSGSVTQRDAVVRQVGDFVSRHIGLNPVCRFAVVTSGGTVAPLERQEIRHVTNLSTGQRAAISAEWFLRQGYNVIYFHKTGCLLPFARHFQNGDFVSRVDVSDDANVTMPSDLVAALKENATYAGHLLRVPFHTVVDYQLGMKTILNTVKAVNETCGRDNRSTLIYLVAAVSDFYIPYNELPRDKIDSRPNDPSMTIYLSKVPKALARGLVGQVWGDGAFVTTFKLETNEARIDEKVINHINGFSNIRVVVSNLLETIRSEVCVRDTRRPAEKMVLRKEVNQDLEEPLVATVIAKHTEYVDGRW